MKTDVNRHLLFGLLALQNGLIHQAQLVAAFHAWTTDRSRPLADHLEGRAEPAEPFPIVPLDDIVEDEAVLALDELDLAPDWGDGSTPSPSDRLDVRAP